MLLGFTPYVTADGITEFVRRSSVTPDARKPPWRLTPDVPAHTSPAMTLPAELTRLAPPRPGRPAARKPPWRLTPDVPAHTSPAMTLPAELTRLARTCPGVPSTEMLLKLVVP